MSVKNRYYICVFLSHYSNKNDINIKQIVAAITAHFKPMVFDRVEYIEKNIVEPLISENF